MLASHFKPSRPCKTSTTILLNISSSGSGPGRLLEEELRIPGPGDDDTALLHRNPALLQGHDPYSHRQEVQLRVSREGGRASELPAQKCDSQSGKTRVHCSREGLGQAVQRKRKLNGLKVKLVLL